MGVDDPPGLYARGILGELAATLADKTVTGPVVVAIVGAGASTAAGLPAGGALKQQLWSRFDGRLTAVLKAEAREVYPNSAYGPEDILQNLSLFEFAAVVSRIGYCRELLDDTIAKELAPARVKRRPLSYELLAHLAKHRFIDHFIVLNYDTLLDEAVEDELPERAYVVASSRDVPSRRERRADACYLVRPFGRLGRKPYSITTDDVEFFGPDEIRKFIHEELPRSREGQTTDVVLLLLGYAAAEPCFASFVRSLGRVQETGATRNVTLYVIDIVDRVPPAIAQLEKLPHVRLRYIQCHSDTAVELLLSLMHHRSRLRDEPVWIPAARHFLVGKCCTYENLGNPSWRFKLELLLQGVKSRGFVHLESFSYVKRLRKYGGRGARQVIQGLLDTNTVERDDWLGADAVPPDRTTEYVPNYMITSNDTVVEQLFGDEGRGPVMQWTFAGYSANRVPRFKRRAVPFGKYVLDRLEEIERAPEIEIVADATPEAKWILGDGDVEPLRSIQELTTMSQDLLGWALGAAEEGRPVRVLGIWSTGEWLFHRTGWAHEFGDKLLERPNVDIRFVMTASGGRRGTRSQRRDEIVRKFATKHAASVAVREMNWWEVNRVLTLVYVRGDLEQGRAIYMRRRLSRPLVSPYLVRSDSGLRYLREVWETYYRRSRRVAGNALEVGETGVGYPETRERTAEVSPLEGS